MAYPRKDCADSVKGATDPEALTILVNQADTNVQVAYSLLARFEQSMDFVVGAHPVDAGKTGGVAPSPQHALDKLNELNTRLYSVLDQIDSQLRRLERVVG